MAAEKWSPSTRAPGVGGLDFEICWSRAAAQKQATIDPVMQPEPAESENCRVCQTLRKVSGDQEQINVLMTPSCSRAGSGSQQGAVRGQIFEATSTYIFVPVRQTDGPLTVTDPVDLARHDDHAACKKASRQPVFKRTTTNRAQSYAL